jgi:DNA-3-methyladenine glycosylase
MVEGLGADFFDRPAREVAPDLIGCVLEAHGVAGVIVEVERYESWDAASHSFRGPTPRSRVMFGPPGRLYVYRSYGLHWCANVVCGGRGGAGAAVLLRAVEPRDGLALMRGRRGSAEDRDLCRGPGRLAAAFAITGADNGTPLMFDTPGLRVLARANTRIEIVQGPRVGISRDVARPWRYALAHSSWVSRPRAVSRMSREWIAA